jgi:hypothetical protein
MIVKTRIRIVIDYNEIPYNADTIVQDESSQVLMRLSPSPIPQTKQDQPFYQQKNRKIKQNQAQS